MMRPPIGPLKNSMQRLPDEPTIHGLSRQRRHSDVAASSGSFARPRSWSPAPQRLESPRLALLPLPTQDIASDTARKVSKSAPEAAPIPETQAAAENAPNASEAPNGGTDPTNIARSVVGATVNAALRATAAELHKGTPREWFNECAGGQEFASLVNEGNMSPRLRDVVATAAGICDDTGREPDSTADTFLSRASSTA